MLIAFASTARAEKRVALVIGNSAYAHAPALPNPKNDARTLAAALRRLHFDQVLERSDLTQATMLAELRSFGDLALDSDWAVVFYAGHGMQMDGQNFLIPVDARLARASDVEDETVALDRVMSKVREARKLRLIILDACRDNPFAPRMEQAGRKRALGRGLAPVEPEGGELIAYAARDGQQAADGDMRNSPFTAALLANIEQPGVEINLLFRRVRGAVLAATNKTQEPFVYGSLPEEQFYFNPANAEKDAATGRKADGEELTALKPPVGNAVKPVAIFSPGSLQLKVGEAFRDCQDCPEMVVVPAGSFMMGSPANEPERFLDEGPQRKVTIANPFAVGKHSVTFAEWDACVADGGCGGYAPSDEGWGRGDRPVINVSWENAQSYVQWLSRKTGKGYRLPSEAEREYFARAGTTTAYWWGASITPNQANYLGTKRPIKGEGGSGERSKPTVPVHSFTPNPWGLYQVHGNVWEWTEDCWNDGYSNAPTDGSVRRNGDCSAHVPSNIRHKFARDQYKLA